MTAFKIEGSSFKPTGGISKNKKPEAKKEGESAAQSRGAYDTVRFRDNRLAVMPRMSAVSGNTTRHVQGETVESLLKDSAAELDDYFSQAYGFKE